MLRPILLFALELGLCVALAPFFLYFVPTLLRLHAATYQWFGYVGRAGYYDRLADEVDRAYTAAKDLPPPAEAEAPPKRKNRVTY